MLFMTRMNKNIYLKKQSKVIKKAVIIAAFLCLLYVFTVPKPLFEKACVPKEARCQEFCANLDSNGKLTVYNEKTNSKVFISDSGVYVYDFILADITADGSCDLLFALWKRGSFGDARPFWHKNIEISDFTKSAHLYAYSVKGEKFHSIWCSSALKKPIKAMIETEKYSKVGTPIIYMPVNKKENSQYAEYWYWNAWGFRGENTLQ